jgi:hypothetical protein
MREREGEGEEVMSGLALECPSASLPISPPSLPFSLTHSLFVCCSSQDLLNGMGSGNTMHEDGAADLNADIRSTYIANSKVAGIEQADLILLIGTNPR